MRASNDEVTDGDDQNITDKAVDRGQTASHIVGKDNMTQATITESKNMISFSCECNKTFKVSDQHAGKRATCKACGAKIVIPQASTLVPVSYESWEQKILITPQLTLLEVKLLLFLEKEVFPVR